MTVGQLNPVGPHPGIEMVFLGSLMWCSPQQAQQVLELVEDDDMPGAATATVLAAIRRLVGRDTPPGPQLVLDELSRVGERDGLTDGILRTAASSGAAAEARREYASAVVAQALRRHVESAGTALASAASDAPEHALAPMVLKVAQKCLGCSKRLKSLRGEY